MFLADLGQLRKAFLGDVMALAEVFEAAGEPNADVFHNAVIVPLPRILDHHTCEGLQ